MRALTLRRARRLHARLACFFAPLLLLYAVSGASQLYGLHEKDKAGYAPPALLEVLGRIHVHQYLASDPGSASRAAPFRLLSLALCAGLLVTLVLGMLLASATADSRVAWRLFLAGALVPAVALGYTTLSRVPAGRTTRRSRLVGMAGQDGERRVAQQRRVLVGPETAPELAALRAALHGRVRTACAEADAFAVAGFAQGSSITMPPIECTEFPPPDSSTVPPTSGTPPTKASPRIAPDSP